MMTPVFTPLMVARLLSRNRGGGSARAASTPPAPSGRNVAEKGCAAARGATARSASRFTWVALVLLALVMWMPTRGGTVELDCGAFPHLTYTGGPMDFTIPTVNPPGLLTFQIKGADGGGAKIESCSTVGCRDCFAPGGKAAEVIATFQVGNGPGQLAPGGTLRFILGTKGANGHSTTFFSIGTEAGGGGGGSGLLYRAPGLTGETCDSDWKVLMAAGGGGGAYQGMAPLAGCVDNHAGQNAQLGTAAGSGGGGANAGQGGDNGNGGSCGTSVAGFTAGGGGGVFTEGASSCGKSGGAGCVTGGAGGSAGRAGGKGFGGGGGAVYGSGGGGGGGYSGGGGGGNAREGGGGSCYVANFALSSSFKVSSDDYPNGWAEYQCACAPQPPINDECANALPMINGKLYGCTDNATTSPEALTGCTSGSIVKDVWYTYTNREQCPVRLEMNWCGATFKHRAGFYASCGGPQLACTSYENSCSAGVTLNPGNTIYLRLGGTAGTGSGESGDYVIDVSISSVGPDSDGDGTPDSCDQCPNDPLNDSDGDGVCDSADICPGFDDHQDSDGDGIPDGCDPCPNLPGTECAQVSNFQCPYTLDQWLTTSIPGGVASTTPSSGPADSGRFNYNVTLSGGGGVSNRYAIFETQVKTNGQWTFQYKFTGNHGSVNARAIFSVAVLGTNGQQTYGVLNQPTTGDYSFAGTVSLPVNGGYAVGFILGGSTEDPASTLNGTLEVSNVSWPALPDADGDSVADACDQCSQGDDRIDTDGDGVPDACDPCPSNNPDDPDGDGACGTKVTGIYTVTNDSDDVNMVGSLRWAIAQANNHPNNSEYPTDTIVFDSTFFSTPRTITLTHGQLQLTDSRGATIIAGPGKDLLTISGNNASRVFLVQTLFTGIPGYEGHTPGPPVVNVEIRDLTIANGLCGTSGSSTPRGGGIHNSGRLTLNRVTVRDNRAIHVSYSGDSWGGGIFNYGILTINDSTIANNLARTVTDTTGSHASGGGILNWTAGTMALNNSVVTDNRAEALITGGSNTEGVDAKGGGIDNEGSATLDQTIVSNNVADAKTQQGICASFCYGGGIYNSGPLTMRNGCVLSGNTATASTDGLQDARALGGGLYSSDSPLTVTDTVIQDNTAAISNTLTGYAIGGGINASGTFRRCTISGNTASAQGNKVSAWGGGAFAGPATFVNSSVSGNISTAASTNPAVLSLSLGGGIYAVGPANLFNVTLAGNSCRGDGNVVAVYGGGLFVESDTMLLRGVTVVANACSTTSANFAAWGGGIYLNTGGTGPGFADLGNTIVAGNTVQSGGAAPDSPDINGAITSQGHNLIGDPAGGSGFAGSDLTTVSALDVFLDIDSNGTIDANDLATGGAASGTFPLRLGSLARNAGDNALIPIDPDTALPLATDQRGTGHPRIVGGTVDIGAYEGFLVTDPNLHVFEGFVNDDFFELANWNSAGTPNPADMAAGDTYLILAPAVLHGAAVLGGELKIDALGSLTVDSAGSLELNASSLVSGDGTLAVKGLLRTTGNGTASISAPLILNNTGSPGRALEVLVGSQLQNTGSVSFQAGEAMVRGTWGHNQLQLEVLADAVLRGDGWLKGGDVGVYGGVEPGPDTGHGDLHIQGSFTHYSTATTRIKVGGIGAGEFDRIVLTGQAALGGTLLADFTERGFAVGGTYQFLVSPHSSLFTYLSRIPVGLASGYTFDYSRDTPGQFTVTAPAPQTFTFTGSVDSDFLNPANWNGGLSGLASPASPRPEDAYIVASDATLSGDADVNGRLTVNTGAKLTLAEGGSLTMNNGANLMVAGRLEGDAALSFPSAAALTLSGGEVATAVTSAGPVNVTANSTISGALTLQGADVSGTALLTIAPTGRLGGVGSIVGPVLVDGSIIPAAGTRVLAAGLTTINGLLNSEINGAAADQFAVEGDLVLGGQAGLQVGALIQPTEPRYLLATYTGNLVGTFGTVTVPAEYELDTSVPHEVAIRLKNQPPVADANSVSTDEDTVLNGTLTATDADGDALTYAKVSDPAHGLVNVNTDGSFTYVPDANYNGPDSFTFKANDGKVDSEPATVNIKVNPVNDAPSFTVGGDVTVDEDSGAYSASQVTGIDDGDPEVTQSLKFNVAINNPVLFAIPPAIAADGTLTFTPAVNANGSASVIVSLTDDTTAGGPALTTPWQSFTITVHAVNDMPFFTVGGHVAVDEDSGTYSASQATGINDGDPEVTQVMHFNVSNNNNSLFSVQPAIAPDGTLAFTPAPNASGPAEVTVSLTDDDTAGGAALTTASQTFFIQVNPVNDMPVFAVGGDVMVDEDSGAYSAAQATGIDDGDPEAMQSLKFNVSNDKNSLFLVQPAIATDGTLTFTPAADAVGSALVTVTLTDDDTAGGDALTTAAQTFTITLRDKTPPVITLVGEASVNHEAGSTYTDAGATATDNLDGDLTSQIVAVNPVDATTLGTYTVTYDVNDAAGNAATQVRRTVTVVDTTDPEFATFPEDVILFCGSDTAPSLTGEPTTTDNAGGEVTLTHEDTVKGTCPGLIERTWTATDASGNAVSEMQEIHLVPHTLVTDASHVLFDLDSTTTAREFRLIYSLDPAELTTYKLGASNPGRFNHHAIYFGAPGETVAIAMRIPYPFVTVSDTPITVHDGVAVTFNDAGRVRLVPGLVASTAEGAVDLGDYGEADQFELVVQFIMPDSGVADLAVTLEHGFKRTTGYGVNSSGDAIDPVSGTIIIPNLASYSFQVIMPLGEFSDFLSSWNEFKKNPGVAGLVTWMPDETPVVGLIVELVDAGGKLVSQAVTDADGFYQIAYKHKGKAAAYSVQIAGQPGSRQDVVLKSNAFIEVNFALVPASE